MTLEEFLSAQFQPRPVVDQNNTSTRTVKVDRPPDRLLNSIDVFALIRVLELFNEQTKELREADRDSLYRTFYIPKKSGGLRQIDAPNEELMTALRVLERIFKNDFHALYHTSAFAYIKGRCTVDAVKVHQRNGSRWFEKLDLSNFFGSTTLSFMCRMFGMVFPFSEIVRYPRGAAALETALSLATKNGVLPQGTPISPTITNIMMIPFDFELAKKLRDFDGKRFVYTRYADDFHISCKYDFDQKKVEQLVVDTLAEFDTPFSINKKKTHYQSSAGRNRILNLVLNKDNEITVGHREKHQFQCMLHSYILDRQSGKGWDVHDVQVLKGHYDYYSMVERTAISNIVDHINQKMNADVLEYIRQDLSA